ncbi:MAG: cupin domain-containing protein [Proteobacteria bacterium]|nr:cupin domain-containing protein [Pseudomonadota bacterium]
MLTPEAIFIDGRTGDIPKANEHYTKPVAELRGLYRDTAAFDTYMAANPDAVGYEVAGYRQDSSDIFFGTTTMYPGKIGEEYFMTRGHYHVRRDCGEAYYTQSGRGLLLLQTREGETREVEMAPGICAFIPPDWAHRSVNTGHAPLVFVWFCQTTAGHNYGDILTHGMRRLAVERDGHPTTIPNPAFPF